MTEASQKEFIAYVKLWSSGKGSSARKGAPSRKPASERRNSLSNLSSEDRSIKEKTSWLKNYSSHTALNGYWRPATCKLAEDGDNVLLNFYVDETILQHSVYIKLLRCTDIRPADQSLFFSAECLGIHTKAGQRLLDLQNEDVIYVQFPNLEILGTWLALLRSYAIPETYGRLLAPDTGGLYRMWRQVALYIAQGRDIGASKAFSETSHRPHLDGDAPEVLDMDLFCELQLNAVLSGRTTIKKNTSSPEWHEQFEFSDLPPFEDLTISIIRERKGQKPQLVGFIQIGLSTFRRGELVDGWFPVISRDVNALGLQVGEVRLKIKMDEEIILPGSAYTSLMQATICCNTLDLLNSLENKFKLQHISINLMAIAIAKDVLISNVLELAKREVSESTRNSRHTLFRGNTTLTKTMELAMSWYGKKFLEASVGSVLRRLYMEKVAIEVDPIKNGKGSKDLERNSESLAYWCGEFWTQIYSVRMECPNELRFLFSQIRVLVESHYEIMDNSDLRWQSVSAFCFLRFIVPAILHPHLFGLCPGLPSPQIQRSLTLIAKVLQSLANLKVSGQKEEHMKSVSSFARQSLSAMIDYLIVVSTPPSRQKGASSNRAGDSGDRIRIMSSLRSRASYISTLHHDTISPHLYDIPKHLAILSSAVVRNARRMRGKAIGEVDPYLDIFIKECFKIESQALSCVTLLAPRHPIPNDEKHFLLIRSGDNSSTSLQSSDSFSHDSPNI